MEPDIKKNFSDLMKIPQQEFEKHFRDWMERDDVARSLQAKLRTDLIANFNKTSLGKQILSQTSTTSGAAAQRLTLSPLVLALNTLVAEFLYAQNCHFSLSVFCSEIPFRNTLPDFESARYFRFTAAEVVDIFEAISGGAKSAANLGSSICKAYETNSGTSLLLQLLKGLLDRMLAPSSPATVGPSKAAPASKVLPSNVSPPHNVTAAAVKTAASQTAALSPRAESKVDAYNTNFRYLNKYLLVLSRKVQDMALQFERLQRREAEATPPPAPPNPSTLPRTRVTKTVRHRKYDHLNRSLERITDQLKQLTLSKRRSKRVGVIVQAIEAMSQQFEKCAHNFESVSKDLKQKTDSGTRLGAARGGHEKATATEPQEKTYVQWVHEMRNSRNGQKFLDRIEISLGKALSKQKKQLASEMELKLQHQKELLKIRYKQKLMEQISKALPCDKPAEATRKIDESVELQLKLFEMKHYELLNKIRLAEESVRQGERKTEPSVTQRKSTPPSPPHAQFQRQAPMMVMSPVEDNKQLDIIGPKVNKEQQQLQQTQEIATEAPRVVTATAPAAVAADPAPPPTPTTVVLVASTPTRPEVPALITTARNPLLKDAINTQKQLQEMVKSIAAQERNVDHIVYDAKLRLQVLENESNQLEQSFRDYLERQRLQKQANTEAANDMWHNYALEKNKIENKYEQAKQNIRRKHERKESRAKQDEKHNKDDEEQEDDDDSEDVQMLYKQIIKGLNVAKLKETMAQNSKREEEDKRETETPSRGASPLLYKNAIMEAKAKLFNVERKRDNTTLREATQLEKIAREINEREAIERVGVGKEEGGLEGDVRVGVGRNGGGRLTGGNEGGGRERETIENVAREENTSRGDVKNEPELFSKIGNESFKALQVSRGLETLECMRPAVIRRGLDNFRESRIGTKEFDTSLHYTFDPELDLSAVSSQVSLWPAAKGAGFERQLLAVDEKQHQHDNDDDGDDEDDDEDTFSTPRNDNKENMLLPATHTAIWPTATATTTTTAPTTLSLNKKMTAMPTSLVLQQSMAKMNQLFGMTEKTKKQQHSQKVATSATTTLTRQQQVAATSSLYLTEKNPAMQPVIESMATLKRAAIIATTTSTAAPAIAATTTSITTANDKSHCNEAKAFNAADNKEQKQQQKSAIVVGQLSEMTGSNCSSDSTQSIEQKSEVGEVIEALNVDVAVAATADIAAIVAISTSSSNNTSFELQLSTGGGGGGTAGGGDSDFWT